MHRPFFQPTLLLGGALWMLAGAASVEASVITQTYAVLPGQVVHVCSFACELKSIEGTLTFDVDVDSGVATPTDINVLIPGTDFALRSMSAIGIEGALSEGQLQIVRAEYPLIDWTFDPVGLNPGDTMTWEGTLKQACCDQYAYTFGGPGGYPVVDLVLTPEPGTFALLRLGLAELAVRREERGPDTQ